MSAKLKIWDERMLELMRFTIAKKEVPNEKAFLTSIGFLQSNLKQVIAGRQSFQTEHMVAACMLYGRSMDWMTGLTDTIELVPGNPPIENAKLALHAVEMELARKS